MPYSDRLIRVSDNSLRPESYPLYDVRVCVAMVLA